MKIASCLAILALAASALSGREPNKLNKKTILPQLVKRIPSSPPSHGTSFHKPSTPIINQTEAVKRFAVNGSSLPDVDFDIGESYAGLLPIGPDQNVSELYFWFFPSSNPKSSDEILIWLNGGPGCSSLEGLLQENGAFLWQYGTYKPVKNPYTWVNLTNVVWVEQPAGTGFSPQKLTPPATDQIEVAKQFLGFWKNFVDTFGLHNRTIYIAGESYAGYYVPYIADAMHNETDSEYYNVESIMIYDPLLTDGAVEDDILALPFLEHWASLFNLNASYTKDLKARYEDCGFAKFLEEAFVFPPKGPLPTPPDVRTRNDSCRIYNDITAAATLVNPCWDIYQVATTCPLLWDVLGAQAGPYLPEGASIYFNRTDVQNAINAPVGEWAECTGGVLETDNSDGPALSVLPRIIGKNKKTIIAHAELDMVLMRNRSILAIQDMTWGGTQGFSERPETWNDFYVPYHEEYSMGTLAGAGNFGKWHTERGLTFCTVELAGHMVPQYAPSAAYRQLEFLLGRIDNLGEISDFTTQSGDLGNGNATVNLF